MSIKNRLRQLEAAKIQPGFCACAQIEHRYLKPLEEPQSIHCGQCGFPRMTIWIFDNRSGDRANVREREG